MPIPIFAKGPINKVKVMVGEIDMMTRTATFFITEKRVFKEANAFGIDKDVFKRKSIRWCQNFIFKFEDGSKIGLTREEFVKNAWLYPYKNDPDFKAPADVFKPKLVLTLGKIREIIKKRKKETQDEYLERLSKEGVFS